MPRAAKKRRSKSTSRARAMQPATRSAVAAALGVTPRLGARTEFRIYPSIGIARVGDSKDSFLIGPEAPGVVPTGPFRDSNHHLKPQAARFRIYKVEIDANENETVTEEVVRGGDVKIEWSVTLANRKAAGFRIIETLARVSNPGRRNARLDRNKLVITASGSITGSQTRGPVLSGEIEFARPGSSGPKVTGIELATLRTDEEGRLLVVGGPGTADSPLDAPVPDFADMTVGTTAFRTARFPPPCALAAKLMP